MVSPIFIWLFLLLFEWGMVAYDTMQVQAAAQAGAQYASVHSWDYTAIAAVVAGATTAGSSVITADPANTRTFYACPTGTTLFEQPRSSLCADNSAPRLYGTITAQAPYSAVLPMPPGTPALPTLISARATRRLQ